MKLPYRARNPSAGVLTYELLDDEWGREAIILEFADHKIRYLYNADRPGPQHITAMRRLAQSGDGLTTYVNQHVRENYAAKLPR